MYSRPLSRLDTTTINGLGYNPYRDIKHYAEDPCVIAPELAGHFIKVLEKALAKKGYSAIVSGEIEVGIHFDSDEDWTSESLRAVKSINRHRDHTNQKGHIYSTLGKAYIDGDIELCTAPTTPYRAAKRISHWQQHLAEGKKLSEMPNYLASFEPYQAKCVGQHINVSLHQGAHCKVQTMLEGESNLTHQSGVDEVIVGLLNTSGLNDLLMLYNGKASLERWKERSIGQIRRAYRRENERDSSGELDQQHIKSQRIENTLPDAACPPPLSILSTLSALYLAICMAESAGERLNLNSSISAKTMKSIQSSLAEFSTQGSFDNLTVSSLQQNFEQNSLTMKSLNQALKDLAAEPEEYHYLDKFKRSIIDRAQVVAEIASCKNHNNIR